jgi:mercuric ion transport protein
MKPESTLVYDADCPNLPAARGALREALGHEGLEPQWVEYDRAAPGTPALLLRFGSPTILVEGVDVAGEAGHAAAAASCRVYRGERGLGVPPAESIAVAIANRAALANTPRISKSPASGALGLAGTAAIARPGTV